MSANSEYCDQQPQPDEDAGCSWLACSAFLVLVNLVATLFLVPNLPRGFVPSFETPVVGFAVFAVAVVLSVSTLTGAILALIPFRVSRCRITVCCLVLLHLSWLCISLLWLFICFVGLGSTLSG
jgi:hypothetical protein